MVKVRGLLVGYVIRSGRPGLAMLEIRQRLIADRVAEKARKTRLVHRAIAQGKKWVNVEKKLWKADLTDLASKFSPGGYVNVGQRRRKSAMRIFTILAFSSEGASE